MGVALELQASAGADWIRRKAEETRSEEFLGIDGRFIAVGPAVIEQIRP